MVSLFLALLFVGIAVISHLSARGMARADPEADYWRAIQGEWLFGRVSRRWPAWAAVLAWIALCVSGIVWAVSVGY